MNVVKLHEEKAVVSTFDLFKKFGYKEHRVLKRVVAENKHYFDELGFLHIQMQKVNSTGRPTESYLLNEDQFILLIALVKNTKESVELKVKVSSEFRRMRNILQSGLHTTATMKSLNELTKKIESDKNIASHCGKELQKYKAIKIENEQKWRKEVNEAQLSLGFK